METSITITGQISGNRNLLHKLQTNESRVCELPHNNYELIYMSRKDAAEALSQARIEIKEEEPDYYNQSVSYLRGVALSYDASTARINNSN